MKCLAMLLFTASASALSLKVDVLDTLNQIETALNKVYTPLEMTAQSIAAFVQSAPQGIVSPTPEEAGVVTGVPKGDLATALWTSFQDVQTNGLWVAFNDSRYYDQPNRNP